jgi:hypothetical protein
MRMWWIIIAVLLTQVSTSPHCTTPSLLTHATLKGVVGSIILYLPSIFDDLNSCVPASLYKLHHALLSNEHITHMYAQNKHYQRKDTRVIKSKDWNHIQRHGLDPHSILIVPDVLHSNPDELAINILEQRGGRVLKWQLSVHNNTTKGEGELNMREHRIDRLSSTDFIHRAYLCKGLHVLPSGCGVENLLVSGDTDNTAELLKQQLSPSKQQEKTEYAAVNLLNLQIESDRLFRGRHVQFVTVARNNVELHNLWPMIISLLIAYPLSDIEVLVPTFCDNYCVDVHGGLQIKNILNSMGLLQHVLFRRLKLDIIAGARWQLVSPSNTLRQYTMYLHPEARVFGSQLLNNAAHILERTTFFLMLDVVLITLTKSWISHVAQHIERAPERLDLLLEVLSSKMRKMRNVHTKHIPSAVDITSLSSLEKRRMQNIECVTDKVEQLRLHELWKLCGTNCIGYLTIEDTTNTNTVSTASSEKVQCLSTHSDCFNYESISVDNNQHAFVYQKFEDPVTASIGFSWHYLLEEQHTQVVSVLSNMIENYERKNIIERNILILRESKPKKNKSNCEILIIALDRKASHIAGIQAAAHKKHDRNWFLDIALGEMSRCQIVGQQVIGTVNTDILRPQNRGANSFVFLAATLSMDGGSSLTSVRSARTLVLTRLMEAATLLRTLQVNCLGLLLLRDEFLTAPQSILNIFDVVLRHHYGKNEAAGSLWLPLGWDPGYIEDTYTPQSIPVYQASKREYLANWIGNISPRFFSAPKNITVINPSRRNLHKTLSKMIAMNQTFKFFVHSNLYYSGFDSVHLLQQDVQHTHLPLHMFRDALEKSTFTIVPCSINTIDSGKAQNVCRERVIG